VRRNNIRDKRIINPTHVRSMADVVRAFPRPDRARIGHPDVLVRDAANQAVADKLARR
jgi:hypothetical protein